MAIRVIAGCYVRGLSLNQDSVETLDVTALVGDHSGTETRQELQFMFQPVTSTVRAGTERVQTSTRPVLVRMSVARTYVETGHERSLQFIRMYLLLDSAFRPPNLEHTSTVGTGNIVVRSGAEC